jgi:phosphodiesterase/alkaline phosphatase D-like protein
LLRIQEEKFLSNKLPVGIAAKTFVNLTSDAVYTVLKNDFAVGVARTFPPENTRVETVRFGFGSCSKFGDKGIAFDHLLRRDIS